MIQCKSAVLLINLQHKLGFSRENFIFYQVAIASLISCCAKVNPLTLPEMFLTFPFDSITDNVPKEMRQEA
jgi:hypothetical protein